MAGNDRATVSNGGGRLTLRALGGLVATLALAWAGAAAATAAVEAADSLPRITTTELPSARAT